MRDNVDWRLDQWRVQRPDINPAPMGVVGRVQRASRLLERELHQHFATHELQLWEFDVLATLRRAGPPYQLTTGALVEASMVTSGAITNRLDRLVARELVTRETDPTNRRRVLVTLADRGREMIDDVLVDHLELETKLLAPLSSSEQTRLVELLRKLLIGLGDGPPDTTPGPGSTRQ